MIPLKVMLPEGEGEFRNYINRLRINPSTQRPDLNDPPYSREFSPRVMLDESPAFGSKMEMAEYLDRAFAQAGLKREDVIGEKELWTYIAYLWFDGLTDNLGNILKREEYYIATSPHNYRRFYLHLVGAPYILFASLRENSRIFNYDHIWKSNDFAERVASNQFLISHPNIIESIDRLYFDATRGAPKVGATNESRKGNIRRFIRVIQQLELTYDIYSMPPQQIINLLPQEFGEWRR